MVETTSPSHCSQSTDRVEDARELHHLQVLPVILLVHQEVKGGSELSINLKFVIIIVDYYYRHVGLPQLLDMQDQTISPPY
jgi:hypothetical protein